jgi:hypothetical protein
MGFRLNMSWDVSSEKLEEESSSARSDFIIRRNVAIQLSIVLRRVYNAFLGVGTIFLAAWKDPVIRIVTGV